MARTRRPAPRVFPPWLLPLSAIIAVAACAYAVWAPGPTPTVSSPVPASGTDSPGLTHPAADAGQEAWVSAGNQHMDAGLLADAISYYSRALDLDSTIADVWVDRGACKHGVGDHDGAIEDFRRALKMKPLHTIAHLNLGIVYLTSNTPDSARAWWNRLLLVSPTGQEADRARTLLAQLDSLSRRSGDP